MGLRKDLPRSASGTLEHLRLELAEAAERGALATATDAELLAIARAALRLAEVAARRLMALSGPR